MPTHFVVILTDDQDLASLGYMPKLAARSDLLHFPNAYMQVGLCGPSRAALLTGQYDTHNGVTSDSNTEALERVEDPRDGAHRGGVEVLVLREVS